MTCKLILLLVLVPFVFASHKSFTAHKDPTSNVWTIVKDIYTEGPAQALWYETVNQTGWDLFEVVTNGTAADEDQAYGAGFLEGGILHKSIWASWKSMCNGTEFNVTDAMETFIITNDDWVRSQAANPTENEPYWNQVALVLKQFDGLLDGYNKFTDHPLTRLDMLLYQLQFEYGDLVQVPGLEGKHKPLVRNALTEYVGEHCSALIKPAFDGTENKLFFAHDTWSSFNCMLRTYKHYTMNYGAQNTQAVTVSFSSYPGLIPSGDDFYVTSANLGVMETTNDIMNKSLYSFVTTTTVPYYIRVVVANRMSASGKEWSQIFALYNSGTYNNQYMIVDYNLYTPGQALQPGTLWIVEQIPGFVVSNDETQVLIDTGYWASYNIPYFEFVYNISGYGEYYEKYGNMWSYSECARAKIFRRDQSKVQDLDGMKAIMRYNEYQTDPLSLQDACRGIAARCDLNPPWVQNSMNSYGAFGAMDSKITDNKMAAKMEAQAISGPTYESQPPFAWTNQWQSTPHFGQPEVFAFQYQSMKPTFK